MDKGSNSKKDRVTRAVDETEPEHCIVEWDKVWDDMSDKQVAAPKARTTQRQDSSANKKASGCISLDTFLALVQLGVLIWLLTAAGGGCD